MTEVFISYSRRDRSTAEALAGELTRLGVDVWWDSDLLGGENYRTKTAAVISRSPATIVIWSRSSVASEWVVGEASAARERKTLIPVSIDGVDVPLDFRSLNTIDLSNWSSGESLPNMLVKAIGDKTGRVFIQSSGTGTTPQTRLLQKSLSRSWYSDFECLLFSLIAQGFASALTMIPLAIHYERLAPIMSVFIAVLNATITGAIIMRLPLSTKRLGTAAAWFCVAIGTGVAGYFLTLALWQALSSNEYLTFVGFWSLGLVIMLDVARRAASER